MANGTYRGALESGSPQAAAQAQAAGLTIGPDGWWRDKTGKKLSHTEADKAVEAAGVAKENAHQQWGTGGLVDRNRNFTGNLLKNVAPLAAFIPGVGPLAAAGLSGLASAAGSGIQHGTNFGDIAKQGVVGAAEGYGAGKGLQAFKGAGGGLAGLKAGLTAGLGAKSSIPGAQSVKDLLSGPGGGPGGGPSLLDSVGDFFGGNGGMNALALAQGANAAYLGQKSGNFADMAAKNVDENWKMREPLRVQGLAGLTNPQAPDLSALRRTSARGNPFADRPQPVGGQAQPGVPAASPGVPAAQPGPGDLWYSGPANGPTWGTASLEGGPAASAELKKLLGQNNGPSTSGAIQGIPMGKNMAAAPIEGGLEASTRLREFLNRPQPVGGY